MQEVNESSNIEQNYLVLIREFKSMITYEAMENVTYTYRKKEDTSKL